MSLRGALIGLGNIAVRGHLPAYARQEDPAGLRIVAAADLSSAGRDVCARELPGAAFYADPARMLAEVRPDFIDICTPPHTHAGYVREGAELGAHILCEKPLADRFEAVAAVTAALDGKPVVFVPCHQYRYSPLWTAVGSVLARGSIGEVSLAQFSVYRTQADRGAPEGDPLWRTKRAQSGGGILADTGAHYFYLVQQFFGLPDSVHAVLRTLRHGAYDVEDTALVTLEYGAAAVQLTLTWAAGARANALSITGSEGGLRYDGTRLLLTGARGTEEIPMPDVSDKNQYVGWYASLLGEFAGRIRSGDHRRDLLEESVNVMKLLDLCYRSGAERRAVEFR